MKMEATRAAEKILLAGGNAFDAAVAAQAVLGQVDPARVAITGGSAGGFTTLLALTKRDYFRAGGILPFVVRRLLSI